MQPQSASRAHPSTVRKRCSGRSVGTSYWPVAGLTGRDVRFWRGSCCCRREVAWRDRWLACWYSVRCNGSSHLCARHFLGLGWSVCQPFSGGAGAGLGTTLPAGRETVDTAFQLLRFEHTIGVPPCDPYILRPCGTWCHPFEAFCVIYETCVFLFTFGCWWLKVAYWKRIFGQRRAFSHKKEELEGFGSTYTRTEQFVFLLSRNCANNKKALDNLQKARFWVQGAMFV